MSVRPPASTSAPHPPPPMRPALRLFSRRAVQLLSLAEAGMGDGGGALPSASALARTRARAPTTAASALRPPHAESGLPPALLPPAMALPIHLPRRGGRPPPLGAVAAPAAPATTAVRAPAPPHDVDASTTTTAPPRLVGACPSSPRPPGGVAAPWLTANLDFAGDEGVVGAPEGGDGEGGGVGDAAAVASNPTAAAATAAASTPAASPLQAAPHDAKLSLFYRVYGDPAAGARGRDDAARAARDALALFHATFGPPPGAGRRPRKEKGGEGGPAPAAAAAPPAPAPSAPAAPPPTDPARLTFPSRLLRGTVLARPNRFTMTVRLEDGEVVAAHCPVTGSLGGLGLAAFDGAGVPCLLSRAGAASGAAAVEAPSRSRCRRGGGGGGSGGGGGGGGEPPSSSAYSRRTRHTVEAVCLADPATLAALPPAAPLPWVGINQLAANRYLEHFMRVGALPDLVADPAGLAREVAVPGGSRLDFVYQGRDLVEVKSPLEALPLLAAAAGGAGACGAAAGGLAPNPALVAALAARRAARGSLLSRYPVARRAAMYERAARHAAALAEHLASAREAERRAARRARATARRAAKAGGGGGNAEGPPPDPPAQARAMLVHCFQFDAPPVRRAVAAPKGASPSPSVDGRAAVLAAMRAAAAAGVEAWQVNLTIDPDGVSLGDCFRLDLFADERRAAAAAARAAARGRARRAGSGGGGPGRARRSGSEAAVAVSEDEEEEWVVDDAAAVG